MNIPYLAGWLAALIVGFIIAQMLQRRKEAWKPGTEHEHQANVHGCAWKLNVAMHHAREAGYNPTLKIAPMDNERGPGERPIIASVERASAPGGGPPRRHPIPIANPVGTRRFSKYFDNRELVIVKYKDDDNWWFLVAGDEKRGVLKARTPLSEMPFTREEAYA